MDPVTFFSGPDLHDLRFFLAPGDVDSHTMKGIITWGRYIPDSSPGSDETNDSTPHSAQIHREAIAKTLGQNSLLFANHSQCHPHPSFANECNTGQTAVVVENIAPPADHQCLVVQGAGPNKSI